MSDDWLAQLSQLHEDDKAKRQASAQAEAQKKQRQAARKNKASELLRQSRAYELLRQVQKALLGGQGLLDILEATEEIDRTIRLIWQGPISNAHKPDPKISEVYYHISVEVKKGKLWVNGASLASATPTALKAALLQASKNPGQQKYK